MVVCFVCFLSPVRVAVMWPGKWRGMLGACDPVRQHLCGLLLVWSQES